MAGFYEKLINVIIIVSLLLALFVCVDYADTITYANDSVTIPDNVTVVDSNVDPNDNVIIMKHSDKLHTDKSVKKNVKKKYPTISMWAKPSVRSGYSYTWHKFTFVDYCPNCRHYYALLKNPKMVPEREYTCRYCDSDFCAVTGKEKFSWSHVYLRKA